MKCVAGYESCGGPSAPRSVFVCSECAELAVELEKAEEREYREQEKQERQEVERTIQILSRNPEWDWESEHEMEE